MTKIHEPVKGIEIIDLALYLKEERILILADVHIGYEEALTKQGVLIPKFHFRDIVERLELLFETLDRTKRRVDTIIINGDLKHEFGTISEEEWRNTIKFIGLLSKRSERIVLIRGNHDSILGPIAEKKDILLVDQFLVGDILICHGDVLPDILSSSPGSIRTIIIGHEHPAVSLKEGVRSETFKAFLVGKYDRKDLIVQPSFNQMVEGTDVLQEGLLSPFLKGRDLGRFEAFIVADVVYPFGKLKALKK
ncbi:TPA: metallophosphoesterase [Candidatus Woesearchaeota archaeon]|nr:metallophosphoesterase [Candidatus Woesearchaeota archaeon]